MKRSNPTRSVPHADLGDGEDLVSGRPRDPDEFKAHRAGRRNQNTLERFEKMSGQETPTRNRRARVDGADGSWPDRATEQRREPRPPAILVLLPDLLDGLRPAAVYGQYPRGFIAKMLPHLGCARSEVLHLCSGSLRGGEGIRVDCRAEAQPDIVADVTRLPLADNSVAAVMADPPYSAEYARRLYGVKYPRPAHVLREAVRVVRPGGVVCFVHYITPRPAPGSTFVRCWAMSTGFDMPVRAVTLYQKDHPTLEGM